jgi:hypothetical protein
MVKRSIIGLDTNTYWLTDRQSQYDSDSLTLSLGDCLNIIKERKGANWSRVPDGCLFPHTYCIPFAMGTDFCSSARNVHQRGVLSLLPCILCDCYMYEYIPIYFACSFTEALWGTHLLLILLLLSLLMLASSNVVFCRTWAQLSAV